jgi:Flp pilus assembly pilin Flp
MESRSNLPYTKIVRFWRDRSGQGILEYGLILGLVAMVAIGALLALVNDSSGSLAHAGNTITTNQSIEGTGSGH